MINMPASSMTVQLPPPVHLGSFDRDERRPQADPLPMKRGEIGFVETVHGAANEREDENGENNFTLPPRHPADRDYPSPSRRSVGPSLPVPTETRTIQQSASNSSTTAKGLFGRLKPKKATTIGGLQLITLLFFSTQLIVLGGTIAIWVFTARRVKASQYQTSSGTLTVFIHVMFVVGVLGQLVFLERQLYRLRAEKRHHLYGDVLPRHMRSPSLPESIRSAAPWNRPPLPTYATVLAQSGVGTGDVEDNLIAIPPPPAYGNVRGSTLLSSSR